MLVKTDREAFGFLYGESDFVLCICTLVDLLIPVMFDKSNIVRTFLSYNFCCLQGILLVS